MHRVGDSYVEFEKSTLKNDRGESVYSWLGFEAPPARHRHDSFYDPQKQAFGDRVLFST